MLAIDESSFAELNRAILQSAIESQVLKKTDLLKKATLRSAIRKKVIPEVKMTQHESLLADIEKWKKSDFAISDLSQLVEDINAEDISKKYLGIIGIRKLLSHDDPVVQASLIQPIIDAKLIPTMIEFLQVEDEPRLQLEAAWALTNVMSGTTDQTEAVIQKGAIPWFVKILRSNARDLKEQATWALGNISGDSAELRDLALKHGALQPLLKIIEESHSDERILERATWAISNLCRRRPRPTIDYVRAAIPTLFNILQSQTDPENLRNAGWALSSLVESPDDPTMELVMACSISTLVSLLSNSNKSIVRPCLRVLGTVCTLDEAKTNVVLNCPGFFEKVYAVLDHTNRSVRQEALWLMSNITAGTAAQNAQLFKSFPFVTKLISIIENDEDPIKKEALWVLSNALAYAEEEQRLELYQAGILNCYISMLESNKADILEITLNGIHHLLLLGEVLGNKIESKENLALMELQEKGAFDRLDALQDYDHDGISTWLMKILTNFIPSIEIRPIIENSEDDNSSNFYDSEGDE